jgi:hypothetical protein
MGTTTRDPSYLTTEAEVVNNNINVVSFRFRSSLKVDRLTGACLQGGPTECLGQRWLRSNYLIRGHNTYSSVISPGLGPEIR